MCFSAKKSSQFNKGPATFLPKDKSMLQKDVNGREVKADFLKKIFEEFVKALVK